MKTSPSSVKIRQIITQLREGKLVPRPEFQRRLVWTPADKARFIDTVLREYPFPEIYVANGSVDVDTGEGQQLLVDGQQRVTTLAAYFYGEEPFGVTIPSYSALEKEEKERFLNYDVAVRDLGSISNKEIIEVFKRINSTKYALNEIEVNNAIYAGELMSLASALTEREFFERHKIFRPTDVKRMGDVRFMLHVIITMIEGYFNRDEQFEKYLREFNDVFPEKGEIEKRVTSIFDYIEECGFSPKSRIWKRSDLFTAIIEIDRAMEVRLLPDPGLFLMRAENFFRVVDGDEASNASPVAELYRMASIQASNDRINRLRRGVIFGSIIIGADPLPALKEYGFL